MLSTRARLMRNLAGYPFPHRCTSRQLEEVQSAVRDAARGRLAERTAVSDAEKAMLLGSRLVSPEFAWRRPGRSVFLDQARLCAAMVNEEDHLRLQAVTPGFSIEIAVTSASELEEHLAGVLPMARDPRLGYLAASPTNSGLGRRVGVMLHLPGLAGRRRLTGVLDGLRAQDLDARGLMGELSSGIGAFVQVSSTAANLWELSAACKHLCVQERTSRAEIPTESISTAIEAVLHQTETAPGLSLRQAVNCVSWLRLAAATGRLSWTPQALDALLALLSFGPQNDPATNVRRAQLLRRFVKLTLAW